MTTIVTRAGKGSALTWTEGDANIENLNNDKIENVVEDTTPSLGGDLDVNGNDIISVSNGNITVAPNGTGQIVLQHNDPNTGSAVIVGNGTNTGAIASNGATSLVLLCDPANASGQAALFLDATTGNVDLAVGPQTGAKVTAGSPVVQVGNGAGAATITTNGAQNLTLNTNSGANTGSSVVLGQGTNGSLQLNASGTGSVVLNGTNNATGVVIGRRSQTTTSTGVNVMAVQRNYTQSTLSGMDGHFAGLAFSQRDSTNAQSFYTRIAGVYSTSNAHSFTFDKSANGFTTATRQAELGDGFFALGDVTGTADQYLTTNGAKSLNLITAKGAGGGASIRVNAGTDADVEITADGTGHVSLSGILYPNADGANGEVLQTDGAGNLEFKMPQTLHSLVHNADSVTINKGEPVYVFGANGANISVKRALNTGDSTSAKTLGLAAESIAAGATGQVVTRGYLAGVDTQGYTAGATIYLGATAGSWTATKPYAPNHLVYLGEIVTVSANGRVYIRTQNGYELDEIHDVQITSTPSNGQVLAYETASGLWKPATVSGSGITDLVQDTTPQLGGNLDVQSNSITTSVTNGNITINPNGTGDVLLTADTVFIGDSSANGTLQSGGTLTVKATSGDGAGLDSILNVQSGVLATSDPLVSTNGGIMILGTTAGYGLIAGGGSSGYLNLRGYADGAGTITGGEILIPATANSNITINPQGTGDVYLQADTVRVGDSAAAATITTFGAGTLTLNTNAGTNSGSIVINQGTNQNISLTPNGTGDVQLVADTVQIGDANAAAFLTTNGTGNLTLNTNNGTNSGNILITAGAGGNIDITPNGGGRIGHLCPTNTFGFGNNAATITTTGTGNLTLSTNQGTNSGSIVINQGINANIEITPNGTGKINLDGAVWPNALGSAGQVLSTDASGVLSWATPSGGATNTIILYTAGITIPNSSNGVDTGFWNILDSGGVSGVSVSQGSITLPAGTYQISVPTLYKPNADSSDHKIRCTTDSTDMFTFSNSASITLGGTTYLALREFNGRFIFGSSKTFAFTNATSNTSQVRLNTLPTSSAAANSTYSQINQALTIKIQKIA